MDAIRLRVLEAEIEAQLARIDQVYAGLDDRAGEMRPETEAVIESTAYQLHNLYNAVEDLLKIAATAFENSVADLSRWHTELLDRMSQGRFRIVSFLSSGPIDKVLLNAVRGQGSTILQMYQFVFPQADSVDDVHRFPAGLDFGSECNPRFGQFCQRRREIQLGHLDGSSNRTDDAIDLALCALEPFAPLESVRALYGYLPRCRFRSVC